jgi:hypothetical protein
MVFYLRQKIRDSTSLKQRDSSTDRAELGFRSPVQRRRGQGLRNLEADGRVALDAETVHDVAVLRVAIGVKEPRARLEDLEVDLRSFVTRIGVAGAVFPDV